MSMKESIGADRIELTVDGRRISATPGESVAAALINDGVWAFRRSVRGEDRGPVCGMGICHECRVTIDGTAHRRACLIPVKAEMEVRTGE
jgi:D-hydroxyproline dehydrogenase subunit gamma